MWSYPLIHIIILTVVDHIDVMINDCNDDGN